MEDKGCFTSIPPIAVFFWVPALIFEPVICLLVLWIAWGKDLALRVEERLSEGNTAPATDVPDLVKILAKDRCASRLARTLQGLTSCYMWLSAVYFLAYVSMWSLFCAHYSYSSSIFAGLSVNAVMWIKRSPYIDASLPYVLGDRRPRRND